MSKSKAERLDLVNGVFDKPALLILLALYHYGQMLKTELRDTILRAYNAKFHQDTITRRLSKLREAGLVTQDKNYWKLTREGADFVDKLLHTFADLWDWLGPLKKTKTQE